MVRLLLLPVLLLLAHCGPDLGSVVADLQDLAPVIPDQLTDECINCMVEVCNIERFQCYEDEVCEDVRKCKTSCYKEWGLSSPDCLINCDVSRYPDNEDELKAYRKGMDKYRAFHDCVFSSAHSEYSKDRSCKKFCGTGTNWNCLKKYEWNRYTNGNSTINLNVRVHRLNALWDDSLITPGEPEVGVEICNTESSHIECTDSKGNVTILIKEKIRKNPELSFFRQGITCGSSGKEELGPITPFNLAKFFYYIGRPIVNNQMETVYIPLRGSEIEAARKSGHCNDLNKENEEFTVLTAKVYDCLGQPAEDIIFEIKEDPSKKPLYWSISSTEGEGKYNIPIKVDDSESSGTDSLGMASFFCLDTGQEEKEETEVTIKALRPNDGTNEELAKTKVSLKEGSTTFVVMYPYPKESVK